MIEKSFPLLFLAAACFAAIDIYDPAFKPNSVFDYCIIAPPDQGIFTECQRLAGFKTERGLKTRIVRIDSIQNACAGRDIQEKIRTCIQYEYVHSGITWVLLAGDFKLVPARTVYTGKAVSDTVPIVSDIYYSCLGGTWDKDGNGIFGDDTSYNATFRLVCRYDSSGAYLCDRAREDTCGGLDLLPDVYIGRLPVSNGAEAKIIIDKIISYSSDVKQTEHAQDIFLFGPQMFSEVLSPNKTLIDDSPAFLHYQIKPLFSRSAPAFSQPHFSEVYEDSITPEDVVVNDSNEITKKMLIQGFSAGPNCAIFSAHGSPDYILINAYWLRTFDITDILAIQSETYSNVISLSCSLMKYDPDSTTCFAKSFLVNPHGGAVSFCGYSEVEQIVNAKPACIHAVDALTSGTTSRLAVAYQNAHKNTERFELYAHQYWGDPEMELWTKKLTSADTIGLAIGVWRNRYIVSLTPALDSVLVCLCRPGGFFSRGYSRAGKIEFDTAGSGADSLVVTATKHNFLPGRLVVRPVDVPEAGVTFAAVNKPAGRYKVVSRGNDLWLENAGGRQADVLIFNAAGRLVSSRSFSGTRAWVGRFGPGLYIVRIATGARVNTQNLILCK
jgi:hypothetical protein